MNENIQILKLKLNAVKNKNIALQKLCDQSKQDNKDALSLINNTICDMHNKLSSLKQKHEQFKKLNDISTNNLKEYINVSIHKNSCLLNDSLNYNQTDINNNAENSNIKFKNILIGMQKKIDEYQNNINQLKTKISKTEKEISLYEQKIADIKIFASINFNEEDLESLFKICTK